MAVHCRRPRFGARLRWPSGHGFTIRAGCCE